MSAHDKTWIDGKLCRRYIYGFDTNDTTHNGWYKICSISTTTANMTYSIRLRISSDNFVNFLVPTIDVTIKFITEAANTSPGVRVHFNSSITDRWTNLFGLLYAKYNTAPSSGGTCTIYFNKKAAYQKIVVDVLDETVRGSTSSALNYQNVWTFDTSNTFVSSVAETGFQVKEFNALVDNGLIGSDVQPVYINAGGAIPCSYQLNATVPADAKFTDTTYSVASQSEAGLMSVADKKKLDSGYVVKSDDGGLYIEI